MGESLERFINRKRLFVRVQANVPRELFVQKLSAAFPGARIGVGNASAERGPVTQRVADINYDSAAEATQALRRNRFKLKVGNHDADITYQIERKDVVEKLAGEWGCRFMVVVKNLPPGEVSCAELSDLFEQAGEIFTIKILPGNRGEPYALVQYVEEMSVDQSIQQINQQKLHGAVLYVERHLKARRQGGGVASTAVAQSGQQQQQAHSNGHSSRATSGTAAGGGKQSSGSTVHYAQSAVAPAQQQSSHGQHQQQQQLHSSSSGGAAPPVSYQAAAAGAAPPPAPPTAPALSASSSAPSHAQQQQQQQGGGGTPANGPGATLTTAGSNGTPPAPLTSPTAAQQQGKLLFPAGMVATTLPSPSAGSTASGKPPLALDSGSLFNMPPVAAAGSITLTSPSSNKATTSCSAAFPPPQQPPHPDSTAAAHGLYSSNGGASPSHLAAPGGGQHATPQLQQQQGGPLGVGGPAFGHGMHELGGVTSPSALLGASAAALRNGSSGPLGGGGGAGSLLMPMLDLFSHLRDPQPPLAAVGGSADLMLNGVAGGSGGATTGDGMGKGGAGGLGSMFAPATASAQGLRQMVGSLLQPPAGPGAGGVPSSGVLSVGVVGGLGGGGGGPQTPGGQGVGTPLMPPQVLSPTSATTPHSSSMNGGMRGLAGPVPGLGRPCGVSNSGLPAGMQVQVLPGHPLGSLGSATPPPLLSPLSSSSQQQQQLHHSQMQQQQPLHGPGRALSPTAAAALQHQQQQQHQHQHPQQQAGMAAHLIGRGGGGGGGAPSSIARISIRDSLRLALGRLEELVTCPITGEIMREPVIAADGFSYERSAIQTWLASHSVSPLSGEALAHKVLTPNRLAKDIIADILPS